VLLDSINVMDAQFGVVGDGTADDRTALQAAFDYASTNNLNIYIPPKTYKISDWVQVWNSTINVYASGAILKTAASNKTAFIYGIRPPVARPAPRSPIHRVAR
jgi:hypothetical protein